MRGSYGKGTRRQAERKSSDWTVPLQLTPKCRPEQPGYHACTHQLEYALGAEVEKAVRGRRIAGATFYRIIARGFALLREVGYLPESS